MSRIRLEWNIESQKIDRANGEDPLCATRSKANFPALPAADRHTLGADWGGRIPGETAPA